MSEIITGEGYYISFNPDTRQGFFGDADGGPETALVLKDMPCGKDGHSWTGEQFFLLKGDFVADYQRLIKAGGGLWELKNFYHTHKRAHGSRWSSDFQEWGKDGRKRPTLLKPSN